MLFFGISFAAGILMLRGVQQLDIECTNPPKTRRAVRNRKSESHVPASAGSINGAVYLQQ